MFSYRLPDGIRTRSYLNVEGQIKFDPPVYEQRYTTAVRILEDPCWNKHFKKIVDFGCAELRLLPLLRRINNVEHILAVDIDESLLQVHQQRAVPLISDYLQKRENPLRIEVLKGSISSAVENLRNVDAVIALEIIEHLYPDVLEHVPHNIFGFMQPKLAIFSTPNSEFNVLFEPLLPNGFRHLDHKFEWNRTEFKDWAQNICQRYPNYSVAIIGVGKPPPDHKKIGYVSQIAIFARNDIIGRQLVAPISTDVPADSDPDIQYKEIYAVDYPFYRDERSKEQKILDEARFHIDSSRRVDRYFNRERNIYEVPITRLISYTLSVGGTEEELLKILKENDIEVKGEYIILPEFDDDDYGGFDDCFDYYDREGIDAELDGELAAGGNNSEVVYDSDENWD